MDVQVIGQVISAIGMIIASVVAAILQKKLKSASKDNLQKLMLPQYEKKTGHTEIDQELSQIYDHLLLSYRSFNQTSVYLRKYEATIELFIKKDIIVVNSTYTLIFVNPYHVAYSFKRKPMLRCGLQYDTYSWKNVLYQGQPCIEYVHEYPSHQIPPNNRYRFKTGLEIPLAKDQHESVVHYSAEYSDDVGRFFNTYCFWHFCKMFSIDVRLSGPDANKYEIQWEVFLSSNDRNNRFSRNVHCNDPHHVSLCDYGWLEPSDGYVITINRIS
jgi:hypothetical protein